MTASAAPCPAQPAFQVPRGSPALETHLVAFPWHSDLTELENQSHLSLHLVCLNTPFLLGRGPVIHTAYFPTAGAVGTESARGSSARPAWACMAAASPGLILTLGARARDQSLRSEWLLPRPGCRDLGSPGLSSLCVCDGAGASARSDTPS